MLFSFLSLALSRRASPSVSETRLGPYTLERKLGEGGMGVVYAARHSLLGRRTAIKVLRAEHAGDHAVARFEREVQATARLSHPNIVPVYDYGRSPNGTFYYAMEYLDGVDLEQLVAEHGPQPPSRVAHIMLQAADALAEAHAAGVVHRDIKPANLVLCANPRRPDLLKVVDFGLVKDLTADHLENANELAGTPLYMAPEAVTAPEQLDARADIYALGAVAYSLLTGAPPFRGSNVVDVLAQHLHAPVVPPSLRASVPADLEAIILRCLAKSPADRFASAADLVAALEASSAAPCSARRAA
jgi:eukaryotic-like serine/threonine-protein kinase